MVKADSAERILVATFSWQESSYLVSFVYFEDFHEVTLSALASASS
jgi:hypothetical protein